LKTVAYLVSGTAPPPPPHPTHTVSGNYTNKVKSLFLNNFFNILVEMPFAFWNGFLIKQSRKEYLT
jgi:hypothetical protein